MSSRYADLAKLIVEYSTRVQPGDGVLIQTSFDVPPEMIEEVMRAVRDAGGVNQSPVVGNLRLAAGSIIGSTEEQLTAQAEAYERRFSVAKVLITVRGYDNPFEMSGVPPADMQRYRQYYAKRFGPDLVRDKRWVGTKWPNSTWAAQAGMSSRSAEDFFFDSILGADYPAMATAIVPLQRWMERTDRVRVTGPETDLSFSIKGIGVTPGVGTNNLPDLEIWTAPVDGSVEGRITYNVPSLKDGHRYDGVWLEFRSGRVENFGCRVGDPARLKAILDTDEGARHVGEFALGFNPLITRPTLDTAFDEKISGTLHVTPGFALPSSDNGNRSAVHWDLILDQRPPFGGTVEFDGVRIRDDGRFVLPELEGLNAA